MKALAKFLTVVTLVVVLLGGYIIWAANISVVPAGALVESAADRQPAFDSLTASAAVGSPDLVLYNTDISPDSADYIFVTYTVNMENRNLLPAEWLQLSLSVQDGDVLMIKPAIEDILPMDSEKIELVLMTSRSNSASYTRSAVLTYYVYGHEITMPLTLGAK